MKSKLIFALFLLTVLIPLSSFAEVGKSVLVELNGQWYPATIAEEKENFGVKAYRVTYTASGGQEWIAPNRILLDVNATKPKVGEVTKLPDSPAAGLSVSIEYNGGWYPGKLAETSELAGTKIYKVTYDKSGLVEWVASNRIKAAS